MTFPNGDTPPDDQGQAAPEAGTVEGQENNASQPSVEAPEVNAPWAEYLEGIPTSLHGVVGDAFKKFDGQVTQRFQDLHSQYDPYKPIIEAYEPEPIQQAIALVQALENDPKAFYEGLQRAYNFGGPNGEQGAANPVAQSQAPAPNAEGEIEYDLSDPLQARLAQQEQLMRALADKIIGEDEAKAQAQAEAEQTRILDETMASLKGKYGEFDETYVYGLIGAGFDPEQAVQQFKTTVEGWAAKVNAPAQNAPRVMGASGGLPSNRVDPATLGSRDTKNLVAEYLRTAQGG
jgi:hypothetical protein